MKIEKGDYFILSQKEGYTKSQRKDAMQVMEVWEKVMTVYCGNDHCMTKPYSHFEKVDNTTGKNVHNAPYFEDNRL